MRILCAHDVFEGIPGPKSRGFRGIPRDSKGFLAENGVAPMCFIYEFLDLAHGAAGIPPSDLNSFIILNKVFTPKPA